MARPKLSPECKRDYLVKVWLNESEWQELQARAEQRGKHPAAAIRELALSRRLPPQRMPKLDYDTYLALVRIGNSITGALRRSDCPGSELQGLKDEVRRLAVHIVGGEHDTKHN